MYLDDIVIWSNLVEEHIQNVETILESLCDAQLYCNPWKTHLFCTEIEYLSHHISCQGIKVDGKKTEMIVNWPHPQSATQVCQSLGPVLYVSGFIPRIMEHMHILNRLTAKEYNAQFLEWQYHHEEVFKQIKQAVLSAECLMMIDHSTMPENKIFIMTDVNNYQSGWVLSFMKTWEMA